MGDRERGAGTPGSREVERWRVQSGERAERGQRVENSEGREERRWRRERGKRR